MRNAMIVLAGACVLLGMASLARADNSTCANANLLVPDGGAQTGDIPAAPASGLRYFRFVAKANRSYAVMLENLSSPDQQAEIAVMAVTDGCGGAPLPINQAADFFEPVGYDFVAGVGAARVALKSPGDSTLFFAVDGHINAFGASTFRVRVVETTLFNPLWSTAGGFDTVFRIYNTSGNGGGCSVTLDLRRDNNTPASGGASTVTFTLGSNRSVTRTTAASDLALAAGQTGHATLTHDCPPGAIQVDAYMTAASASRLLPVGFAPARQQR
ncbi:MAG TPA: hypothetical protein VIK51_19570 [Vicinamibacteria bacterium]|jgi:hypothetical protein